ncbi:hypothetical protein [Exiguobacterium sp. s56]|uniref:hypothetical protein n=1 Tax=Exiguobacterium sp. s56 TaxID=2751232 RepID=UPI001BE6D40D|nr:hypothetical protein [Exiguobacterium sp. s56]
MNYYIGSSFANIERVRALRDRLLSQGHAHTYDWTTNDRATTLENLRAIGTSESEAIMTSDLSSSYCRPAKQQPCRARHGSRCMCDGVHP